MKTCKEYQDQHLGMAISSKDSKLMLGQIRGGNYQHPGEEEAIDMVFALANNKKSDALILDVGCGLGATASYINKKCWGNVVGVDINKELIDFATSTHKHEHEISFINAPIELLSERLEQNFFDIICAFNSFFLFENHEVTLRELMKFSGRHTELIIFDYIDNGDYSKHHFCEKNKKLLPNCLNTNCYHLFESCSWKISKTIDISKNYIYWYESLLTKLKNRKDAFYDNEETKINKLLLRYEHIYQMLMNGILGGIIIYVQPII